MITTESRKSIVSWQGGYEDVFIEKCMEESHSFSGEKYFNWSDCFSYFSFLLYWTFHSSGCRAGKRTDVRVFECDGTNFSGSSIDDATVNDG